MVALEPTEFQQQLLDELDAGKWYNVLVGQPTDGLILPAWFHKMQGQPMSTLQPLISAGLLKHRKVSGVGYDGVRFPQVRRAS